MSSSRQAVLWDQVREDMWSSFLTIPEGDELEDPETRKVWATKFGTALVSASRILLAFLALPGGSGQVEALLGAI